MTIDTRELTRVHLNSEWLGGDYVAETWRVASKLTDNTHRKLVLDVLDTWPELFYERDDNKQLTHRYARNRRVFDARAKRYVRSLPAYVLATILVQL